jgi:spore germination protein YaaH
MDEDRNVKRNSDQPSGKASEKASEQTAPGQRTEQIPGQNPERQSGQAPGQKSRQTGNQASKQTPETGPGSARGENPDSRRSSGGSRKRSGISGAKSGTRKKKTAAAGKGGGKPRRVSMETYQRRRLFVKIAFPAALVLLAILAVFLVLHFTPSKEKYSRTGYFGIADESQTGLIVDDSRVSAFPQQFESSWYIDLDTVYSSICNKFYYDGEALLYTGPLTTWEAVPGEQKYTDTDGNVTETDYTPCILSGNTLYISTDYLQQIGYAYCTVDEEENFLWIQTSFGTVTTAELKKNEALRTGSGIKNAVIENLEKGSTVTILEEGSRWDMVQSEDGLIGCVRKNRLTDPAETEKTTPDGRSLPEYTTRLLDETVVMAWHQVFTVSGIDSLPEYLERADSMNVITPTWITVADTVGNIQSLADPDYVAMAHEAGVQVWVMVDNINIDIDDAQLLGTTSHRRTLTENIISETLRVGADGVNLDFESVGSDNAESLLQFIRELSAACRRNSLTFSIDNYSPMPHTAYYDRTQQGQIIDYVIVMAYDEHYAGGETAGSTSSISWVKQSAERTIEEVPAERVIVGLPFYTRLWKETPEAYADDGATLVTNDNSPFGTYELTSTEVGMTTAEQIPAEHGVIPEWLDEEQQFYAEYTEDHSRYRIWIEDAYSIAIKTETALSYNTAGVAYFKLGLDTADAWEAIDAVLSGETAEVPESWPYETETASEEETSADGTSG